MKEKEEGRESEGMARRRLNVSSCSSSETGEYVDNCVTHQIQMIRAKTESCILTFSLRIILSIVDANPK